MSLGLIVVGINCLRDQMSGIKCRGIKYRGTKCHQFEKPLNSKWWIKTGNNKLLGMNTRKLQIVLSFT